MKINDKRKDFAAHEFNLKFLLAILCSIRNILFSAFFNSIHKVCLWKMFSLPWHPAAIQSLRLETKLGTLRSNCRCFTYEIMSYTIDQTLATKFILISLFHFDFVKIVCVQKTFEYLNSSAVSQNVVIWLLTLLLLMTIDNLKRFSWVLRERSHIPSAFLILLINLNRAITVINFQELCYEWVSRILRKNFHWSLVLFSSQCQSDFLVVKQF